MPRIHDTAAVRRFLERDRPWTAYALADLSPEFADACEWFAIDGDAPALVLLYRRVEPPIFFAMGRPDGLALLVEELDVPALSLQIQPDVVPALSSRYPTIDVRPMWRMVIEPEAFRPATLDVHTSPLGERDVAAIEDLYADGHAAGEGPDFFSPSMIRRGIFFGVWEGDRLAAVAGTHSVGPDDGVCAIGNVYTRRDRRNRGLAASVTSAVVTEAFRRTLSTVILNVAQANGAAIRVYERLGFRRHCDFFEGRASRCARG